MPTSFLGEGLIFEELLPLVWMPGETPQGLALARVHADNQQLLGAESSLDEVRISEALKDESPALLHELQRLEYKLNILLRLTAEIAVRSAALPPACKAPARGAGPRMVRRRGAGGGRGGLGRTSTSIPRFRSRSRFPAPSRASATRAASGLPNSNFAT